MEDLLTEEMCGNMLVIMESVKQHRQMKSLLRSKLQVSKMLEERNFKAKVQSLEDSDSFRII